MRKITVNPVITPAIQAADREFRRQFPENHQIMRNCAFVTAVNTELPANEAVSITGSGSGIVVVTSDRAAYQRGDDEAIIRNIGEFHLAEEDLRLLDLLDNLYGVTVPHAFSVEITYWD